MIRFAFAAAAVALGLAACAPQEPVTVQHNNFVPQYYQARTDTGPNGEPLPIPAIRPAYLNERNVRTSVPYNGTESAGTIVVDPYARLLYLVEEGGMATRYGVAVGKAGTGFAGTATIQRKAKWPSWTPTQNMINTQPDLYGPLKNGLPGGVNNPLGSRALYLYKNGRDTYYRIHGTMDPSSIGKATSAGCIRLFNQDIMDLFQRVPNGTTVKVRTEAESRSLEGPLVQLPQGYKVPAAQAAAAANPLQATRPAYAPGGAAAAPAPAAPAQPANTQAAFVPPYESAVR